MTTVSQIENKIDRHEFDNISRMLLESFLVDANNESASAINKKEELLEHFSLFLKKYLQLHFLTSSQDKLRLINFIDKLNGQRELLELRKGKTKLADIKLAGQRLGKKSQSAFKTK